MLLQNDLQARISKQSVTFSKHNAVKSVSLMNERQKKKKSVFQTSIRNCLDSKMLKLQVFIEHLVPRVIASMFPCISDTSKPIPRSSWDCP